MKRKLWLVAVLSCVAVLVNTGCSECQQASDCAGKGENLICSENKCVSSQGLDDGGTTKQDGGTTDAGQMDAGIPPMDAGMDAGVIAGECTPGNPVCAGPFHCELSGDAGTCTPLLIALTQKLDGGEKATVFPFNSSSTVTNLGTADANTRLPRFSGDGTRVSYVESSSGTVLLREHRIFGGGMDLALVNAADAGTLDFVQIEYAPADKVLWTKVGPMDTKDGIQWVAGGGGGTVQNATMTGGYGDWSPSGNAFVFSNADLSIFTLASGTTTPLGAGESIEPQVSPDGNWIVFLRPNSAVTDVFSTAVRVISSSGGTPTTVLADTPAVGTIADGGTLGVFAENATWARNGQVVLVRVSWFRDASGSPMLCTPQDAICAGANGQEIVFQQLDSVGAPVGAPVVFGRGVQPSVSPDGSLLAYLLFNGQTGQDDLHVVPIDASGMATDAGFVHRFAGVSADARDGRPRWQPK